MNAQKNNLGFLIPPIFQLCLNQSVLDPVSLSPPRIPSLLWLVSSHTPESWCYNQKGSCGKSFVTYQNSCSAQIIQMCDMVTYLDVIKSQNYKTTDEAFEEQCFLWERGDSVGADFDLFNSQDLLHNNPLSKPWPPIIDSLSFFYQSYARNTMFIYKSESNWQFIHPLSPLRTYL